MRVEADRDLLRGDPARVGDERVGGDLDAGLLAHLADARGAMVVAVLGVDRAAREHPRAAHEALLGIAPHEQDLERVRATPADDHGGRLPRRDRLPLEVERLEGVLASPPPSLADTNVPLIMQKYICESCGFIYDPADGDPDGGIPPGTAFEDIPGDWFCPVCGARKEDFAPYDA